MFELHIPKKQDCHNKATKVTFNSVPDSLLILAQSSMILTGFWVANEKESFSKFGETLWKNFT